VAALQQDPRPAVRLEAARLLACGGVPRLLAHGGPTSASRSPRRGVPLTASAESLARLRSLPAAIRVALHASVADGLVPQMCSALRSAVALGVALSAYEAQALWQLRRAACAFCATGAVRAGRASRCHARGAARRLADALDCSGVIRAASRRAVPSYPSRRRQRGGGCARGALAHPCRLALKAVLWCSSALSLCMPPREHLSRAWAGARQRTQGATSTTCSCPTSAVAPVGAGGPPRPGSPCAQLQRMRSPTSMCGSSGMHAVRASPSCRTSRSARRVALTCGSGCGAWATAQWRTRAWGGPGSNPRRGPAPAVVPPGVRAI